MFSKNVQFEKSQWMSHKRHKLICGSTFFLICPSPKSLALTLFSPQKRKKMCGMIKTTFHRDTFMNKFYKLSFFKSSILFLSRFLCHHGELVSERERKRRRGKRVLWYTYNMQPKSSDCEFSLKSIARKEFKAADEKEGIDNFNIFSIGNCAVNIALPQT